MAYIIELESFIDNKGSLIVGDGILPFTIKRFYFMTDNRDVRAECRHEKSIQALVCLRGSCKVYVNNNGIEEEFLLDYSNKCLIIEKNDWHKIDGFIDNPILSVFSSSKYSKDDYHRDILKGKE